MFQTDNTPILDEDASRRSSNFYGKSDKWKSSVSVEGCLIDHDGSREMILETIRRHQARRLHEVRHA